MNTKQEVRARRDPFKEVLPLADLRVAAALIGRRQIRQYWLDHPTPLRPIGRLKFESLRQVATFALPLLLIGAGVVFTGSWLTLAATVPAGLLLGYALDRKLSNDIRKMRNKDDSVDRGRFAGVNQLSASTGIPVNEITLDMIEKMALDFVDVTRANEAREAEVQATAAAAAHKKTMDRIRREEAARGPRRYDGNHREIRAAAAGGVAAGSIAALADDDGVLPNSLFDTNMPALNPTTGLPLMHGNMGVDVGGTAYGSEPF